MANTISDEVAVELVTKEFGRLSVPSRIAYIDHTVSPLNVRWSKSVTLNGPKGDRTVALYFDTDGGNPDVLVGSINYRDSNRAFRDG